METSEVQYFLDRLKQHKEMIDKFLREYFRELKATTPYTRYSTMNDVERLEEFLLRGGKRLRGAMVLEAYKMVTGGIDDRILKVAASIELLHASTLVHDDIMDESETRRGGPTLHKIHEEEYEKFASKEKRGKGRYGISLAILDGNELFSLSLELLQSSGFDDTVINRAISLWNETYRILNIGQRSDIRMEEGFMEEVPSIMDYWEMVERKTARMFELAIHLGLLFGGATEDQIEELTKYASLLGKAFQLYDDILGVFGDPAKTGKSNEDDIREGKMTYLVITALESATEEEKKILREILGNRDASSEEINKVRKILRRYSLEKAKKKCRELVEGALKHLEKIKMGDSSSKMFFKGLATFIISREF